MNELDLSQAKFLYESNKLYIRGQIPEPVNKDEFFPLFSQEFASKRRIKSVLLGFFSQVFYLLILIFAILFGSRDVIIYLGEMYASGFSLKLTSWIIGLLLIILGSIGIAYILFLSLVSFIFYYFKHNTVEKAYHHLVIRRNVTTGTVTTILIDGEFKKITLNYTLPAGDPKELTFTTRSRTNIQSGDTVVILYGVLSPVLI